MSLHHFLIGFAAEKLRLRERLEPLHDQIARQIQLANDRAARESSTIEGSSAAVADAAFGSTLSTDPGATAAARHPEERADGMSTAESAKASSHLLEQAKKPEAVLLLAHGTPDCLGEMDAYLKLVTGGRGVPPHVVHELQERYAEIGLRDQPTADGPHLTRWTLLQGRLLADRLGVPVYVGMRNWKPFIADVVAQMKDDGISRARTICLAPQNSRTSVGLYQRAVQNAAGEDLAIDFLAGWAEHPLLALAYAERMRTALEAARFSGDHTAVLFTAHSVPCRTVQASVKPVEHHGMVLATEPDTYNSECKKTATRIAAELSDILSESDWYFCFQSQGISGGPWIGPSVEDTLAALKQQGYGHVVLQPVGFLCDHVEILYDIDIAFQRTAHELGMKLSRAESLNDSPTLIQALEDVVLNGYAHPPTAPSSSGAELVTVLEPVEEPAASAA